ncbi:hypothetical protein BDA96_06G156300 [Sorghum bicolor]|uniref:Uncharacterized protein n=1 Tax=Sorghum bicolor TaxID=4558 RepID=A0A921QTZ6_SORBI|nr:hypothetical protein BDA96_06G156300 [Sorghum bicolor]
MTPPSQCLPAAASKTSWVETDLPVLLLASRMTIQLHMYGPVAPDRLHHAASHLPLLHSVQTTIDIVG